MSFIPYHVSTLVVISHVFHNQAAEVQKVAAEPVVSQSNVIFLSHKLKYIVQYL